MRLRSHVLVACVCLLAGCGDSGSESDSSAPPAAATPSTPTPIANAPPLLIGTPATVVWEGSLYAFVPHATDADGTTLVFTVENLPTWADFDSSTGRLSGVPERDDVGNHTSIRIGVSDGQHQVWLDRFDLVVREVSRGSVLLSWQAPSENTDGTPARDLAGFKIHWGTDPKWHTETLSIAGTGITDYRFAGLAPGLYYFATSAVTSLGMESERSDVATILVR